ncbi:uncharacterized protein METZ01_LOCUS186198 [marine metagenome]|uniref:Uncharacterized protein n=1 Tax=marine metagenome TaxID=408172 RepID=A0A382D5Q4_9ZZZZ
MRLEVFLGGLNCMSVLGAFTIPPETTESKNIK